MRANDRQHGGKHYGGGEYQHWDLANDLRMLYLPGTASKYICRWREKNGVEDLEKCIHYIEKTIECNVNIIPVIDREQYFWKYTQERNMALNDGAILFYIMEGEWPKALQAAQLLLAAEQGMDV